MENKITKKYNKDKPKIKQFLLRCTLDELLEIAPSLMKNFGFEMKLSPTDNFPFAVDFEKKVVFIVDKPSLIAPFCKLEEDF